MEFLEVKHCFVWNFHRGKVKNLKIQESLQKYTYVLNPPCLFFFLEYLNVLRWYTPQARFIDIVPVVLKFWIFRCFLYILVKTVILGLFWVLSKVFLWFWPMITRKMMHRICYGFYWSFVLIGIHTMQGWTATTRHGITRKKNTKRLRHTGNLIRKNLQLKDVC